MKKGGTKIIEENFLIEGRNFIEEKKKSSENNEEKRKNGGNNDMNYSCEVNITRLVYLKIFIFSF